MNRAPEDSRFRLIAPLGRGGTAEVVSVHVQDLARTAALKFCLDDPTTDPAEFVRLIKREYALIGGLSYPGLVRLLEPPHPERHYLLMELCGGPTLDKIGRIDNLPLALRLLSAVACNLEYLRAQQLVHGDLKPQNIFLPRDWPAIADSSLFYVKLSDFSLGRRDSEPECNRAGLGTIGYMAPEIQNRKETSHQSDLFAFGMIAYNVLTGIHPFLNHEIEPVKVNARIQEEEVPPVETLRPELKGTPVNELVNRLLAKDPSLRPRTAFEVCEILEEAGSRYPYRRAIRPRHLIKNGESYESNRDRLLVLSENQGTFLDNCTGGDMGLLTLLADANAACGNLTYECGKYHFVTDLRWPSYMRRKAIAGFTSASTAHKRRLIQSAIGIPDAPRQSSVVPTAFLLRHLLRPATIRRLSGRPALEAERKDNHTAATRLYVQAGDLCSAERCAYQAATNLSRDSHWKPALRLLEEVLEFANLTNRRHETIQLELLKGTILKDSGDTDSAEAAFRDLIALLEGRPLEKTLGVVYNKLGDLYKMRSDFDNGLAALQKAMSIFECLGCELEYSHTCNNLGNTYWLVSQLDKSLSYYRKALRAQRRLDATKDIASTLSNIGSVFCVTGKFSRGVFMLNESLRIKRELGHAGEIARTLNNLGYAHYILGNSVKALELLSESLELNRRIGSRKEILFNLENVTSIMLLAGRLRQSIDLLREGLELSNQLNDRTHEIAFNVGMATVLMRMGKLGEATRVLSETGERLKDTDDPITSVLHALSQAQLLIIVNNRPEALRLATRALEISRKSKDSLGRLRALLTLLRLEHSDELYAETDQIITELHFDRMRAGLAYYRAEQFLYDGNPAEALELIQPVLHKLLGTDEDIDVSGFCLIAAECLLGNGRADQAAPYIRRARQLAEESQMLPELMIAALLLGKLALGRKDFEEAYREYKCAFQRAKQMSESLSTEAERERFQRQRHVRQIFEEIKRLGLILGQKERAGSAPARA